MIGRGNDFVPLLESAELSMQLQALKSPKTFSANVGFQLEEDVVGGCAKQRQMCFAGAKVSHFRRPAQCCR
jgi:hypothetical protein